MNEFPKLDPREDHWLIDSPNPGLKLFLRHMPPASGRTPRGVVLYVHGGTFPSALAVAHRFDGRSWRDSLCDAGFDVWALDFQGFGFSSRYPGGNVPLCGTEDASRQLEAAMRFILARQDTRSMSLIAHSWGTMVAGHVASRCPDLVGRMVFFGPIARRDGGGSAQRLPPLRPISLTDQWNRFIAEVPAGEPPVLSKGHFEAWGQAYLDTDPGSRDRDPPSVMTPSGPFQDIFDAGVGVFPYDPANVRTPVMIIRGAWDSLCTDADAGWLTGRLHRARSVTIPRATHLMHLEENRYALYREAEAFLTGREN